MSTGKDWFIIRGAVPPDLCRSAAQQAVGATAAREIEGQLEYNRTKLCSEVAEYVHEHHGNRVSVLKPETRLTALNVCKFTKLDRPARMSGKEGDVYFVVALSELSESTGMFTLFGRHEDSPGEDKERVPTLGIGDAIVWTRSNQGRNGSGAGGISLVILYR